MNIEEQDPKLPCSFWGCVMVAGSSVIFWSVVIGAIYLAQGWLR